VSHSTGALEGDLLCELLMVGWFMLETRLKFSFFVRLLKVGSACLGPREASLPWRF